MKQKYLLLLLTSYFSLYAREIRTPLPLSQGPIHELYSELNHDCWFINWWIGGFGRSAESAYNCRGKEVPYSTLIFNKSSFSPQAAFANGKAQSILNPLLATSIIGPQIHYSETGINIGSAFQAWICENVRLGFRANLPFRRLSIKRAGNCGNGTSSLGGQTIGSVAANQIQQVNGVPVKTYAYRLDFLSLLPYTCEDCPARSIPIVNYHDTDFPPLNPITISNQDVTNQTGTPVSLIRSAHGSVPRGDFAIQQAVAQQLPIENDTGTTDADRARFDATVNYTPLSQLPVQQGMLFVVPSLQGSQTTAASRVIQQQVNELTACIDQEAEAVFKDCAISFSGQCIKGMGDFDTEIFGGYFFSECLYLEALAGIRWPTGKGGNNPLFVFRQPLGNNGHYEYKLGLQALWQPLDYAGFKADLSWHTVQRAGECVATPFQGACVKNIGRPTGVSIAWDYVVLHAELIFTPRPNTGIEFGYELYHKKRDTICWSDTFANDCLGNSNLVDSHVLSRNTNVTSHKIRAEAFWFCDTFDVYGGGSQVFAGRNAPKERDWHAGIIIYF